MDLPFLKSPGKTQHASWSARQRLIILAPIAVFLIWEVLTRSVASYLADANPEMAIRLRSTNPITLLNLADDRLRFDEAAKVLDVVTSPSEETSHQTAVHP